MSPDEMDTVMTEEKRYNAENGIKSTDPSALANWKYRHNIRFCGTKIDIPPEFEQVEKFRGTLGHKVNHKFMPTTEYDIMDSAR